MNTDLERFELLFNNEHELRNAVVTLLSKMPGISGVHHTHGAQELGKDIVFYAPGALNERRLHACVIKNSRISGSVDSSSGAMNVFYQVQQALDNPYLSVSGQKEKIADVYVMSPYEISQAAIHSIEGSLEKRSGQIFFLCGNGLLNLFRQYWPDFLLFESGILGIYVTYLHNYIEKDDPIAVLIEQHSLLAKAGSSFRGKYVQQSFKLLIHTIDTTTPLPDFNKTREVLTIREVARFEESIRLLLAVLAQPYITQELKLATDDIKTFSRELLAFMAEFEKATESAINAYKNLSLIDKEKLRPARGFPVKESFLAIHAAVINRAFTLTQSLGELISTVNAFALNNSRTQDLEALFSPQLSLYCMVQEMCSLAPDLFRRSSQIEDRIFSSELLEKVRASLLIRGSAGYGKTSFCRWHVLEDVDELERGRSDILPVYVALHQMASRRLGDYEAEFFQTPELRALVQSTQGISESRIKTIRLYLDGLDEVPREDRRREIIMLAKTATEKDPRIQVIVTAREHVSGAWLSWLPKLHINELRGPQIRELVRNLLEADEHAVDAFFAELATVPSLNALMRIPLLGTLVVSVFRKTRKLPQNRIKLYDIFTELLAGGWDLAKNIKRDTQFGPTPKLFAVQRLAGFMHEKQKRECDDSDIDSLKRKLGIPNPSHTFRLIHEILEDGLLIRSGLGYAFSHLSFQEYFAAKDLVDPTGRRQTTVLHRYLSGDDWWKEVLSFYIGIASNPEETHLWINDNMRSLQKPPADSSSRYHYLIQALKSTYPGWNPGA